MAADKCYIASIIILFVLCLGLVAAILFLELRPKPVTSKVGSDCAPCITKDCPKIDQKPCPLTNCSTDIVSPTNCSSSDDSNCSSSNCSMTDADVLLPCEECLAPDDVICLTKDCALTAAALINSIDASVNPCADFYQFSCGNFITKNPVKHKKHSFSMDDLFRKSFELQLENLVKQSSSNSEPNIVGRFQEAYHVCVNTTFQKDKELTAFKNFTKNILNWPFIIGRAWKPSFKFLGHYLASFEQLGFHNPLVNIDLSLDNENATKYAVRLDPPEFYSLSFQGGIDDEADEFHVSKHMKDLLFKLLHLLGNDDQDSISRQLSQVMKLVVHLTVSDVEYNGNDEEVDDDTVGSVLIENESDDINYDFTNGDDNITDKNLMTFDKLFNLTSRKINWVNIVNRKVNKMMFTTEDLVYVSNPTYFQYVGEAVKKFSFKTFINLFGLEVIFKDMLEHAGPKVDHVLKEFVSATETYEGITYFSDHFRNNPRWLFCLETMKKNFDLVFMRLFVQKYIDMEAKTSADDMIQLIQKAYKQAIQTSDWLANETKQAAFEKVDQITSFVGYPDIIFDDIALDRIFETFPEVKPTHFENYLMFLRANREENIPAVDETESLLQIWKSNASLLELKAVYSGYSNSIWLPFAYLQFPYFEDDRIKAVNFGMMGTVIGHELAHAFLDDDNLRSKLYDLQTDKDDVGVKSGCFIDQYSTYCPDYLQTDVKSTCVNGKQTLNENLADHSGLQASYLAYKLWVEENGVEKKLPGLTEYTADQIFFMSYAYSLCDNISPDSWVRLYSDNARSPAHYRVVGVLSNSEYFRDAFNCSTGPMNLGADSCTLW